MSSSTTPYLSYQSSTTAAPAPPPKPSSHEVTRQSTPAGNQNQFAPHPPPPPPHSRDQIGTYVASEDHQSSQKARLQQYTHQTPATDPGPMWLPKILEDKSKQDLADVLARPELLSALAYSSVSAHASVQASQEPLKAALDQNVALATHLNELETRLSHLRTSTQSQLLAAHQMERQWKQKQSDMDRALAPFSPSSLYQRLSQGVQEQEMVCRALEESFLDGDGGTASEREGAEWVRRYREAKKLYYSRQERKERWDEGRVGGWR